MGKRKAERQSIAAQCKYGEDDDLIQWYQSLEIGTRQNEVKRLLRLALGMPQPVKESIYQPLSLDDIDELVKQRIKDELARVDKTFDEMWDAMQREIHGAFSSMDYRPKSASQYEAVEEIETVDEETLRIRKENMQKDQW